MEEPRYILEPGTRVRTHSVLGGTGGMFISSSILNARKPDAPGEILGVVGGHGGDVYFVNHGTPDVRDVAAYCFTEFELDA